MLRLTTIVYTLVTTFFNMKLFKHDNKSKVYEKYNRSIDEAKSIIDRLFTRAQHVKGLHNLGFYDASTFKCEALTYPIDLFRVQSEIENIEHHL